MASRRSSFSSHEKPKNGDRRILLIFTSGDDFYWRMNPALESDFQDSWFSGFSGCSTWQKACEQEDDGLFVAFATAMLAGSNCLASIHLPSRDFILNTTFTSPDCTPIIRCIREGFLLRAEFLLQKGANPAFRDSDGWSALVRFLPFLALSSIG